MDNVEKLLDKVEKNDKKENALKNFAEILDNIDS